MTMNCWEFKKCGREKDKSCCAVRKNAGQICFLVAGTMCDDQVQGMFAQKIGDCQKCDFYLYLQNNRGKMPIAA